MILANIMSGLILNMAEISAATWSEGLSRNEHVRDITFSFGYYEESGRNLESLLRVIATRDILEEVTLNWSTNGPELVDRFLQSIQLNPMIHTVKLAHVQIAGTSLACFLNAATSDTTFEIFVCTVEASERDQGLIDLAAAFQRNTRHADSKVISMYFG
jgi:hypothetical protein